MISATGPRTKRGKSRSSQNAAKHWIESGRILPSEQKQAAFLRCGFVEDFNPQGLSANEVIDDMVLNRLIRRRIDVAFTREFRKASAAKTFSRVENYESTSIEFSLRCVAPWNAIPWSQGTRLRPDLCIGVLQLLRDRIKEHGLQPEKDLETVRRIYGGEPTEHAALLMVHLTAAVIEKRVPTSVDQEEVKAEILKVIEKEVELQENRLDDGEDLDAIEFASDIQEPAAPALETLLRYRACNTREFKDLLETLERIRRLRRTA